MFLVFNLPFGKKEAPKNLLGNSKPSVGDDKSKKPRVKKEPPKPWTLKDRIFVVSVLVVTLALGIYFWYKGQGRLPEFKLNFHLPSFEEKIIVE